MCSRCRAFVCCQIRSPSFVLDFSLKTGAAFISAKTFDWCNNITPTNEAGGLLSFISDSTTRATSRHEVAYASALCYHVYPGNTLPWDPNQWQDSISERVLPGWMHTRWTEWYLPSHSLSSPLLSSFSLIYAYQVHKNHRLPFLLRVHVNRRESFQSLYEMQKLGRCPYFYYRHRLFAVLFVGGESHGRRAVVGDSSRGLRILLHAAGKYLHFIHMLSNW